MSDARRTTRSVSSRTCASRSIPFTCSSSTSRSHGLRCRSDCLPAVHLRATARPLPRYEPSVPSARQEPQDSEGTIRCDVRSSVYADSSWPPRAISVIGRRTGNRGLELLEPSWRRPRSTATAQRSRTASTKWRSATSSRQQNAVTINYQGVGLGAGPHRLLQQGDRLRRQRRCRTRPAPRRPTRSCTSRRSSHPITVAYNLEGVKVSSSRPETISQDLLGPDHELERRRDQGRQPEAQASRPRRSPSCTGRRVPAPPRTSPACW